MPRTLVQNEAMAQHDGWFSVAGGDKSHLTDEQRQIVEDRSRDRGNLLGVVQVRVYENGCEPYVTFPRDAVLGVETDQSEIAEMVARARAQLVEWQRKGTPIDMSISGPRLVGWRVPTTSSRGKPLGKMLLGSTTSRPFRAAVQFSGGFKRVVNVVPSPISPAPRRRSNGSAHVRRLT